MSVERKHNDFLFQWAYWSNTVDSKRCLYKTERTINTTRQAGWRRDSIEKVRSGCYKLFPGSPQTANVTVRAAYKQNWAVGIPKKAG